MITIRRSDERGHLDHGWLDTRHTFSFADYRDPAHDQFRALRVLNEDWIQPDHGFPTHPHRDMEILTIVLEGELAHTDSLGNGSRILPGDVQRMSAGTGVLHSEFNPSTSDVTHLLQIWILPEVRGLAPSYEQKRFPDAERRDALRLIAARDGREGALSVHQDVSVYASTLAAGRALVFEPGRGRHAWLQVARGVLDVQGTRLAAGDGLSASGEPALRLTAQEPAEFLLFDLA